MGGPTQLLTGLRGFPHSPAWPRRLIGSPATLGVGLVGNEVKTASGGRLGDTQPRGGGQRVHAGRQPRMSPRPVEMALSSVS